MELQAVIFDLFHTLTGPEEEWSDLPWTSDVLGIDRATWNEQLIGRSRWRLTGEERGSAGLRLGLISNADVMEMAPWSFCPLARLIDVAMFSCEVGLVKPELEIYCRCVQALGASATQCVFVGDGGSNELVGAKRAGMSTVFVSGVMASLWPDRIEERRSTSDHHIERISELPLLLGLTGGCL